MSRCMGRPGAFLGKSFGAYVGLMKSQGVGTFKGIQDMVGKNLRAEGGVCVNL